MLRRARYCHGKFSVRPSVCDVEVSWSSYSLGSNSYTMTLLNSPFVRLFVCQRDNSCMNRLIYHHGLWNSLLSHLKDADISYSEFRWSLKTFLFGQWGHGAVWTVLIAPSRNILTYLLTYLRNFQYTIRMADKFANNLPNWISTNIKMFADDTKIWTKITGSDDIDKLQSDLDSLGSWSSKWLLQFNPAKCVVMHIGHTRYHLQ